jgi:hypothetical protein
VTMSEDQPMTEAEFWAALAPIETPKPSYRLYHDDMGRPLFYTMQEEAGTYIEIDEEIFHKQPKHVRVREGLLIELVTQEIRKLTPNDIGVACDPRDICVIVDSAEPHTKWSIKIDETN